MKIIINSEMVNFSKILLKLKFNSFHCNNCKGKKRRGKERNYTMKDGNLQKIH